MIEACCEIIFSKKTFNFLEIQKQFIRANYPWGKMFPGQLMLLHVKNTPLKLKRKERKNLKISLNK